MGVKMRKVLLLLSMAAFLLTANSASSRSWTDFAQANIRYTLNGKYQSESMAKNAALESIRNLRLGVLPGTGHIWADAKWGRDKCKSYWSSVDRRALQQYVQRHPGKVKVHGFSINGPRYDGKGVRSYSTTVRAEFPCIKSNRDDDDDDNRRRRGNHGKDKGKGKGEGKGGQWKHRDSNKGGQWKHGGRDKRHEKGNDRQRGKKKRDGKGPRDRGGKN